MKLIVGLGNPGLFYKKTRHNVGFMALDLFCKNQNIRFDQKKFGGVFAQLTIKNQKILILKPQKYMNLSGEVVKKFVDFYKIDIQDVLIIHDDMDIEIGKIKLKSSGSSGGHNGLKNIEDNLKTIDYKRIKIGISKSNEIDSKNYVLGKFDKSEYQFIESSLNTVYDTIIDYLDMDFVNLMNKYNKKQ